MAINDNQLGTAAVDKPLLAQILRDLTPRVRRAVSHDAASRDDKPAMLVWV